MSDGLPIDTTEMHLWRELQQITGNASVSVTCARKGREARLTALRNAIDAERAARGPLGRGKRTS